MTITILLDEQTLPDKGAVELSVHRSFHINITAQEAQRKVHGWLIDEISCNIGADHPTLVLDQRPIWRVPAYLSFPRFGRVGIVGTIDIDVETGTMCNDTQCKSDIERTADDLAQRLSPYQPKQMMPQEFLNNRFPTATKLHLAEDELFSEMEPIENLTIEAAN